jgi:RHS repeat-associated protein
MAARQTNTGLIDMSITHLLATDRQKTPLIGTRFSSRCHLPYGSLPSHHGPTIAFCGQPRDKWRDLYHLGNGYRVYNPLLMRFQSADRLSPFEAGGLNAYGYCIGDPVNRTDLGGRASTSLSPRPSMSQPQAGITFGAVLDEVAPTVAVSSAVLKVLKDVSDRHTRPAAEYQPLSASEQAGITIAFWVGVIKAVGAAGGLGLPSFEAPAELVTGASLVSTGLSDWETVRDVYQRMRSSESSVVGMLATTAYQVTGAKLVVDQLHNIGNQIRRSDYERLEGANSEMTFD